MDFKFKGENLVAHAHMHARAHARAHKRAPVQVRESGLEYTIVRPGRLVDGDGGQAVACVGYRLSCVSHRVLLISHPFRMVRAPHCDQQRRAGRQTRTSCPERPPPARTLRPSALPPPPLRTARTAPSRWRAGPQRQGRPCARPMRSSLAGSSLIGVLSDVASEAASKGPSPRPCAAGAMAGASTVPASVAVALRIEPTLSTGRRLCVSRARGCSLGGGKLASSSAHTAVYKRRSGCGRSTQRPSAPGAQCQRAARGAPHEAAAVAR